MLRDMLATLAISSSSVEFVEPRPNAAGAQSRKVEIMMGCSVCAKRCEWISESEEKRMKKKQVQICA